MSDPAKQFFEGIMRDKGYGRGLTKFGEARKPKGIEHE